MKTRIADLKPGDKVDLENDPYADPNGTNETFTFELQTVDEIEHETPECICVYFTDYTCGFPPDHIVDVQGNDDV